MENQENKSPRFQKYIPIAIGLVLVAAMSALLFGVFSPKSGNNGTSESESVSDTSSVSDESTSQKTEQSTALTAASDIATATVTTVEPESDQPHSIYCRVCVPPVLTSDEEVLTDYIERLCDVSAHFPTFEDINDVGLWTVISQYVHLQCHDFYDTSFFSSVEGQFQYDGEELKRVTGNDDYFGYVMGVAPDKLETFMREYYNPDFSIESYEYKEAERCRWDEQKGLIVWQLYGGSPHYSYSSKVIEIREENDVWHVYAIVTGWDDFVYSYDFVPYHYTFTKNANGNFNIMSMREVPESEYPESLAEFYVVIDAIENDSDVAYEYAVQYDLLEAIKMYTMHCSESPNSLCEDCSMWKSCIIIRELLEN